MKAAFLAAVVLALAVNATAWAGEAPLLGDRLDTSGTWVAVISKATIPTHVQLTTEGDVHLAVSTFDLAPGERREVAYTGSGLGWVSARMTPLEVSGPAGALEVRAWVRYVAPPPPAPMPLWPMAAALLAILVLVAFTTPRRLRRATA